MNGCLCYSFNSQNRALILSLHSISQTKAVADTTMSRNEPPPTKINQHTVGITSVQREEVWSLYVIKEGIM